ncbi:MAG TPA: S9 family peptidase [Acidobacteriaceae bacterium]|nr:S9 family peptidase [Acidobacteriaceae bacterium]
MSQSSGTAVKSLAVQPPVARREPAPTSLHGVTLQDDYRWMRDKDSPEVIAYLEAENAWTSAAMSPTTVLQEKLYAEMLSHIKETDESVPYRMGGYFYYTRTVEGSQYSIHCRRAASSPDLNSPLDSTQTEHIILDVNQLAEGKPFMAVGAMAISPDGNLLAYTTDATGFRQYTLHIRDLRTMADLPDSAERVGSLAWAGDSQTLFYSTEDETTKRQDRIFRHTLGAASSEDALVLHEEDERFNIGIGRTRDGEYLLLEAGSHTTNEFRFLSASDPVGEFRMLAPRVDEQEYYPAHRNGVFFIRTNDAGKNFRLVTAPVSTPGREHWTELIPLDPEHPLEDLDLFQTFAVATRLKLGLPALEVLRFRADSTAPAFEPPVEIAFPEPAYSAAPHVNRVFTADTWRYSYQSLVSPPSVYAYNISRADFEVPVDRSKLLKQQEVPGGFDPARYASERIWIDAPLGDAPGPHLENPPASDPAKTVRIPVSIVYRRDQFHRDGRNPLYVYGYGSYGYPLPLGFSPSRLSLLDRGVVMAYAHIRGGGELGDFWHDSGKMAAKRNTFTDFIAAIEALTAQKFGDPARVAIEGGSAGGLLMGAVVNLAAQTGKTGKTSLLRVVLSHVPFVDIMNTMLDATLPLTVAEYEEWGNPNEAAAFKKMLSYSPYDNLEVLAGKPLPAMLVKTSLNDSQVMYWEPAKYVARLRTIKTDDTPLLLHINMDAGHGGASGRYDYLKEIAFDYAFLLTQLGVVQAP